MQESTTTYSITHYTMRGHTMSKGKQATINIRLDEDTAKAFKDIVERDGYTQSLVLREFIKRHIKKNGQGALDL